MKALLDAGAHTNEISFIQRGSKVVPITVLDMIVGPFYKASQPLNKLASLLLSYGAKRAEELPQSEIEKAFSLHIFGISATHNSPRDVSKPLI